MLLLLTLNRQFLAGTDDIPKKASQKNFFLSFNFTITKICFAVRLAEDGTRMGGISFNYPLVYIFFFHIHNPNCQTESINDWMLYCNDFNSFFWQVYVYLYGLNKIRSSSLEVFYKKGVLKNLSKLGKHLCQSLFFNKVAGRSIYFTEYLRMTAFLM